MIGSKPPSGYWSRGDPRRRHLFASLRAGALRLTDRRGLKVELPLGPGDDPRPAVARLELERQGVKIRSRALITTLWSRLVLSDLFLHGIGGGKYDQVTNALIAEFFGLEPLRFMVLSATLHLPIAHHTTTVEDLRRGPAAFAGVSPGIPSCTCRKPAAPCRTRRS